MPDPKALVTEYLRALSGHPKTPELVAKYVSDEKLATHIFDIEAAFPCYEISVQDLIGEGDKVVVRGEFRGEHQGVFAGVQPTGRSVSAGLMIIYAIADGRIADHWMQFDAASLMAQLSARGQSA